MNDSDSKRPRKDGGQAGTGREAAASQERIAKRLARAGVASRREAEALIADGRVSLNGRVLDTPAVNVGPGDRIEIDGEPIPEVERTRLFLFHKPAGLVTTNRDPQGRRTIFDVLPEGLPRLITVGRLDINTEGLLLLTNDGGLARLLELPQTGWLRRYRVRVHGEVDEGALAGLRQGIAVDGVFYGAIEAELERRQGTNAWLTVGLREGKNREVKNVMAALGLEVTRLIRVSYGPFQLADLEEGQVRELRGRTLRDQLGPRLIEESGADFDAPVLRPYSSKKEEPADAGRDRKAAGAGARRQPREEAGGLIRNRRPGKDERRETALSRLSTTAPRGEKPRGKGFGDKPRPGGAAAGKREEEPRRSRTSNVWMAPGARPQGAKKPAAAGEEKIVRVPRKPGDRKALHDAAARRSRPGRAERAATKEGGEAPRREWQPRPEGAERPKRDFKSRGDRPERPARDWKAKPPRPGKSERAAAKESGEMPQREYRPRPKREEGERPRRDFRKGAATASRPSSPAGSSSRERGEGGKSPRPRKPGGRPDGGPRPGQRPGPRKGPPKPRGRG